MPSKLLKSVSAIIRHNLEVMKVTREGATVGVAFLWSKKVATPRQRIYRPPMVFSRKRSQKDVEGLLFPSST